MGFLRDKVSANKYKNQIGEAVDFQNQAAFYITYDTSNPHISIFKRRVKEIYAGDKHKYERFIKAFAGKIMPSVEVCETIYSQTYRVWDSQDAVNVVNFKNKDLHDEALMQLGKLVPFWHKDYWEAYKKQFCSLVVVDLPAEQKNPERPEPYPFILDISRVIMIEPTHEGKVKEIIFTAIEELDGFNEPQVVWYWYNNKFYSKYLIKDDKETRIFEHPHKLNRCPVHFIWNEMVNQKSWILRKGLIVPIFEDLFWFIIKTVESRKADLLYLNPIKQEPLLSCGYNNKKYDTEGKYKKDRLGDVECRGGYLYTIDGKTPVKEEDGSKSLCPNCGRSRHASGGAGNSVVINLDSQAVKDGKVNPADKLVQYITPDIEGIKEQYSRVKDEKDHMVKYSVGSDDQPTKSALNELQQTAIFESKESVLKRLSEHISNVKTDVDRDILELTYPDEFISNRYTQGTKFYLHTVEELLDMRGKAKDPIQKAQIDEQIIEVKYRNNPKMLNEQKLLYKLLPYSSQSDDEFSALVDKGRVSDNETISLRYQFTDAVEAFESKRGSIIEYFTYKFAESVPENKRVEIIRELLIDNIKIEENVQNQVLSSSEK